MKKSEIIKSVERQKEKFEKISQNISCEPRGIFTSEALLVVAITESLGVNLLIESGRARGYSTKLFAEFFKDNDDFKIVSIDKDKCSKDVKYSEAQLSRYSNVLLKYGDAKKTLSNYVDANCVVFIDGPKGDEALLLAADLINTEKVKAVFIHDLYKNAFQRNICEVIFTDTFFSDDEDFVSKFSYLDKKCWDILGGPGEAPYLRKGSKIDSYASTVGVVFNKHEPVNKLALSNYKEYYKEVNDVNLGQFIFPLIPAGVKSFVKNLINK